MQFLGTKLSLYHLESKKVNTCDDLSVLTLIHAPITYGVFIKLKPIKTDSLYTSR